MNRKRRESWFWTVVGLVALLLAVPASAVVVGKNPGQIKGRWLDVPNPADLAAYNAVLLGSVESQIHWKRTGKDQPIDEGILAGKIHEHLSAQLRQPMLFRRILRAAPLAGAPGVLVLDSTLEVEPGSRAVRYMVGFGAGSSKSVLQIRLRDHVTGREVGLYHGFGTGSGMGFKMIGGGARKMTQDDIQENAKKFAELLARVMPAGRPPGGPSVVASAPVASAAAPPAAQPVPAAPAPPAAAPPQRSAGIQLHAVQVTPETVSGGDELDLRIELTLTDPVLSVGEVAAVYAYQILRAGQPVYSAPAREVPTPVGTRTSRNLSVRTASDPGLYTLAVTVAYGGVEQAGAATFRVE